MATRMPRSRGGSQTGPRSPPSAQNTEELRSNSKRGFGYPPWRAGITSERALGTMENLIGKSPIGSPSTCAQRGPSPFGSEIASVDFQASIPSRLRSFPNHSAGKAPRYRTRLFAELVRNSKESSNKFAPVVILNGPP